MRWFFSRLFTGALILSLTVGCWLLAGLLFREMLVRDGWVAFLMGLGGLAITSCAMAATLFVGDVVESYDGRPH